LQLSDIVTSDHGGSAVQESIAQAPACLDQGRPRLWTADSVDPEATTVLEGFDRCSGAVAELALGVNGAGQAERVQPSLYIGHRRA
jgi:hypothetical protein